MVSASFLTPPRGDDAEDGADEKVGMSCNNEWVDVLLRN